MNCACTSIYCPNRPEPPFPQTLTYNPKAEVIYDPKQICFPDSLTFDYTYYLINYAVAPILACCTPLFLLALTIHFFFYAIQYGDNLTTYFAKFFVLGVTMINENAAQNGRLLFEEYKKIPHEQLITDKNKFKSQLDEVITQYQMAEKPTEKMYETMVHSAQHLLSQISAYSFTEECISIEGSSSKLNGIAMRSVEMSELPREQQKWIIYYPGRSTCWEGWFHSIYQLAKNCKVNLLAFNYRGIMRSGREDPNNPDSPQELATSAKMLEEDAQAAVAHLLKQGVKKENILNYGYSLGGGIASTLTDMAICNDRSFCSSEKVIQSLIWIPVLRHIISWMASYLWGTINSFENVRKIQENGKQVFLCTSKEDGIIDLQHASMLSAFQAQTVQAPPTLFMEYSPENNTILERLKTSIIAHTGDIPDTIRQLLSPWLENRDSENDKI